MKNTLREHYLEMMRNTHITVVSIPGFQVKGIVKEGDSFGVVLSKNNQYGGVKDVLVSEYLAIVSEATNKHIKYVLPVNTVLNAKLRYLMDLSKENVTCFAANAYRLTGKLVAFDNEDVVIETIENGKQQLVLMRNVVTVVPA